MTIVSIVSYPFLPAKVGGQKGIAIFNKYLAARAKLICITVQSNDPSLADGYELRNILSNSASRYFNLFYFFTIRKILKQTGATHLVLEHPYYGWLGCLLKWFTGIKLIVHSHNMEGLRFKTVGKWWWKLLWWYERFTHRQANYNFFIHDADRQYAVHHFRLNPARCITVTYGIEWDRPPSAEEQEQARHDLRSTHNIAPQETILLFNGAFNYKPNLDALRRIIDIVNPILQKQSLSYRIIVCGRDIPPDILNGRYPNMIITGFVSDISLYFKGADVFINPVVEGGGIKTKLVEALGYNLNAVSTENGAIGVDASLCNGKLLLTADDDWTGFAGAILRAAGIKANTPPEYFRHFYWGNTIEKVVKFIQ
ncbi:MAG TPA: glycosyltransferase [Chitinophagaceae bacterium]|nr:glycosyltransferase [Chitinophagaceae bacterium]